MDANLIPSPGPKASGPQGRYVSNPGQPQASRASRIPENCQRLGREEIAVAGPDVAARRHAGAAAQHVLIAHEFAVVFSHRAAVRAEAGIGLVGAAGPLPGVAVELGGPDQPGRAGAGRVSRWPLSSMLACTPGLPSGWRRAADSHSDSRGNRTRPTGVGVGLEVAHVRDGRLQLQFLHAVQCEDLPVVALALPIERRAPASAQTRSHPCDSHSSGRE